MATKSKISIEARASEILKSSTRLKKLVSEIQQNTEPLAHVPKFDDLQGNEVYQNFLFHPVQNKKNPVSFEPSRTRRNTVGTIKSESDGGVSPRFPIFDSQMSARSLEAEDLSPVPSTDQLSAKTNRPKSCSFEQPPSLPPIVEQTPSPRYEPHVTGSLEFCTIEADLDALKQVYTVHRTDSAQSAQIHKYEAKIAQKGQQQRCLYSTYFPARVLSCYPAAAALTGALSVESLTDFCFPNGVQVTVSGRAGASYLCDPRYDKFHVMQFTGGAGLTSYACCLTTRQARPLFEDEATASRVLELAQQQRAARCIGKALRHFVAANKRRRWHSPALKQFRPVPTTAHTASSTTPGSSNAGGRARALSTSHMSGPGLGTQGQHTQHTLSTSLNQTPSKGSDGSSNRSFFSKYFGGGSKPSPLPGQLTKLYLEIDSALGDDRKDVSLQQLLELSTLLRRARDSGFTVATCPIILSCEFLLQSYGVGTTGNERDSIGGRAIESNVSPGGESGLADLLAQPDVGIEVAVVSGRSRALSAALHTSLAPAPHGNSPPLGRGRTSEELAARAARGFSEAGSVDASSDEETPVKSPVTVASSRTGPDDPTSSRSPRGRSKRTPLADLLDPRGKLVVQQVAYCLVTTSPHHALVFHVLSHVAAADRAAVQPFVSSVSSRGVSPERRRPPGAQLHIARSEDLLREEKSLLDKRLNFLARLHRLFESEPELYLEYISEESRQRSRRSALSRNESSQSLEQQVSASTARRRQQLLTRRALNVAQTLGEPPSPRTPLRLQSNDGERLGSSHDSLRIPSRRAVSLTGYIEDISVDPHRFPTTQEWTTAILFSCMTGPQIFKVLNLLLMEKSLVIVGRDPGVVTALAFAVTNLLAPFSWQGVFVPLLPSTVKEFFDAPVPFILGTTVPPRATEISSQAAVFVVGESTHTPVPSSSSSFSSSSGAAVGSLDVSYSRKSLMLSNADLRSAAVSAGTVGFNGYFTRLPEVNADLPMEGALTEAVNRACKYFQFEQIYRRRAMADGSCLVPADGSSPLSRATYLLPAGSTAQWREQQINILLMSSMTLSETRLVNSVLEMIAEHNFKFTGDLCDHSAWPKYVRTNPVSEAEEFVPELFMEPIKRVLEFHEAVVQTQLFVGFVDRVRIQHKSLDHVRLFLSDWIYFRMHMKTLGRQDPFTG